MRSRIYVGTQTCHIARFIKLQVLIYVLLRVHDADGAKTIDTLIDNDIIAHQGEILNQHLRTVCQEILPRLPCLQFSVGNRHNLTVQAIITVGQDIECLTDVVYGIFMTHRSRSELLQRTRHIAGSYITDIRGQGMTAHC